MEGLCKDMLGLRLREIYGEPNGKEMQNEVETWASRASEALRIQGSGILGLGLQSVGSVCCLFKLRAILLRGVYGNG